MQQKIERMRFYTSTFAPPCSIFDIHCQTDSGDFTESLCSRLSQIRRSAMNLFLLLQRIEHLIGGFDYRRSGTVNADNTGPIKRRIIRRGDDPADDH
jgi:hypothetical protein